MLPKSNPSELTKQGADTYNNIHITFSTHKSSYKSHGILHIYKCTPGECIPIQNQLKLVTSFVGTMITSTRLSVVY